MAPPPRWAVCWLLLVAKSRFATSRAQRAPLVPLVPQGERGAAGAAGAQGQAGAAGQTIVVEKEKPVVVEKEVVKEVVVEKPVVVEKVVTVEKTASTGPKNITFDTDWGPSGPRAEVIKRAMEFYNEMHPEVTVDVRIDAGREQAKSGSVFARTAVLIAADDMGTCSCGRATSSCTGRSGGCLRT